MYNNKKSRIFYLIVFSFVGLLFLGGCSSKAKQKEESTKVLFAFIGANLKNPVSDLAESYEKETGIKVELTFNNSGALMNQVETMKKGDIFMPGGMTFVEKAKENGFIDQVMGPIAYHTPVIITPKGNSAKINSVEDLSREGVELVIPDKDATAIGKTAYKIFEKTGKKDEIEENIIANLETPAKVLAAITMGQGNAGIVEYSNTFKDRDKLEVIEMDPKVNQVEEIPVTSLIYSTNKDMALDFMKYIQENGPATFEKYGFKTK
ncbi:molybdate ABC transporter substrate-binding protein [Marinisporobacter balticus]|uniref:Molybdate transport system substrate-binding protein n=1 Tax=Marinisporobacter balticus TaxID=2018667 RepID=A0A4V2SAI7_9FIRM|nr:molybdate ABC transporter substrate-binding protein [Marinisporobacter balticus]TCO71830.1 molybdate transport system substrate-binding protein [Marinisporobacter balticus]